MQLKSLNEWTNSVTVMLSAQFSVRNDYMDSTHCLLCRPWLL